jgi:hypothetical protein
MNDAAFAQAPPRGPVSAATNTSPEADDQAWAFSASAYTYVLPDDRAYVQPTVTADRGWLHLEARYNYEALHTGSAWVGDNFSGGKKLAWEVTRRACAAHHRRDAAMVGNLRQKVGLPTVHLRCFAASVDNLRVACQP